MELNLWYYFILYNRLVYLILKTCPNNSKIISNGNNKEDLMINFDKILKVLILVFYF